jgi:hypothetical protein
MDLYQEDGADDAKHADHQADPEHVVEALGRVVDQRRRVVVDRSHQLDQEHHHAVGDRQLAVAEPHAQDRLLHN